MLADRQRFSRWPGAADGAAASAGSGAARVVRSRSAKKINFWCRVIWTGSAWIEPSGSTPTSHSAPFLKVFYNANHNI
jgi:hypothetical protein